MTQRRILVVEDEGIVVLHIKKTLEGLGYDVAGIANSGDDAITKAMEIRPDLVLMDIVLKGAVDGIDAAENIRALFNIPVIYLTAHADEATLQRARATDPFGYIVKPFREKDLYIAIEFALYKSRAEADTKRLHHRLEEALAQVRTLSALLPVCPSCSKVRDDQDSWIEFEQYARKYSDTRFTQNLCPDCTDKI